MMESCSAGGSVTSTSEEGGQPVRVGFLWSGITPAACRWKQAFSPDGGTTRETNWTMDITRMPKWAARAQGVH